HRLGKVVEEFLYPAMEDFEVDFIVDKGAFAKTIKVSLQRFTLVGATTRAGALSSPLRERFGLFFHLDFYEVDDLVRIIRRSAGILKIAIEDAAAAEVARRSRGTPRIANRLLKRVRDYAQVRGDGRVTLPVTREALAMEGVDEDGLDKLDRRFLETIAVVYRGGPVGIDAVAATLNEEPSTLVEMVEPFLLKSGYVVRTPAGRKVTPRALERLSLFHQTGLFEAAPGSDPPPPSL
ncbi:MAG TPA: Holliday junction branch migration DNA helicase RuvB, partial [Bacillota bacterium]